MNWSEVSMERTPLTSVEGDIILTMATSSPTGQAYELQDAGEDTNLNVTSERSNRSLSSTGYVEYMMVIYIIKYIMPLIVLSGITGNIISFLVLIRRRMRHTVVYFYLALLAIADTGVLMLSALKTWIRVLSGFELLHVSDFGCKTIMFLFLISMHMSAWLLVAMTIDRLIAVTFPLKTSAWCTTKRAVYTSISLLFACILLNSHIFGTYHLVYKGQRHKCSFSRDNVFMLKIFPWLKLSTYSILPFVLILVMNLVIIHKIIKSKKRRRDSLMGGRGKEATSRINHGRNRVTLLLLSITCMWLLLTAPIMMWTFVAQQDTKDSHLRAKNLLAKTVCFLLMYINHGINFALYCLSSRNFRKELYRMCCISFQNFRRKSSARLFRNRGLKHTPPTLQCEDLRFKLAVDALN